MGDWLVQINEKVEELRHSPDHRETIIFQIRDGKSFYRVPASAHQGQDRSLYVPSKISIGPYHHGTPSLKQGEDIKEQCLINFGSRFSNNGSSLRRILNIVDEMVDELRDMYYGLDECWLEEENKDAFVRMMVVDACFLLEIMMEAIEARGFGKSRPYHVFNNNEMKTYMHDMLLLDNQIPLEALLIIIESARTSDFYLGVVLSDYHNAHSIHNPIRKQEMGCLEKMRYLVGGYEEHNYTNGEGIGMRSRFTFLAILIHLFFSLSGDATKKQKPNSPIHLLDLYRWGLLGGATYTKSPIDDDFLLSSFYNVFPPATQLEEAQIRISPALFHMYEIRAISFNKKTGLVLQQITISDATKSNFLNAILYERFHPSQSNHFSSYIYLMHKLLKDVEDSKLLRARSILNTTLTDEEVIHLFSDLCKNISFNRYKPMDEDIWEVSVNLRKHFNKNMQGWRKDLFQKYLNSPWAYISIFIAFLIFTFTAFQTIYTILGYYNGK